MQSFKVFRTYYNIIGGGGGGGAVPFYKHICDNFLQQKNKNKNILFFKSENLRGATASLALPPPPGEYDPAYFEYVATGTNE